MSTKHFCDVCGDETEYTVYRPGGTRQLSVSFGGNGVYGHLNLGCSDYTKVLCFRCEKAEQRRIIAELVGEALRRLDVAVAAEAG
jgi:hypothetical protein